MCMNTSIQNPKLEETLPTIVLEAFGRLNDKKPAEKLQEKTENTTVQSIGHSDDQYKNSSVELLKL